MIVWVEQCCFAQTHEVYSYETKSYLDHYIDPNINNDVGYLPKLYFASGKGGSGELLLIVEVESIGIFSSKVNVRKRKSEKVQAVI